MNNFSKESALKFIETLTGNENTKCSFQTFDDCRKRGDKSLIGIVHCTIEEGWSLFTSLNKKGAGIFVTINETNLKGRRDQDVVSLRAAFVDSDTGVIKKRKLEPSMTITSANGEHDYFILEKDVPLECFERLQKTLAFHLNTDMCVHNLGRVMRLPGLYHQKNPEKPFMVCIKTSSAKVYSLFDLYESYPPTLF